MLVFSYQRYFTELHQRFKRTLVTLEGGPMKIVLVGVKTAIIMAIITASVLGGLSQETLHGPARPVKLAEGVYYVGDFGCNVAALIGPDGVLMIDSGSVDSTDQILAAVRTVTDARIRIVVDTHFHFDHVGGNEALARQGGMILAHERTRKRMTMPWDAKILDVQWPKIPPYPALALPRVTFPDSIEIHFNGEDIEALHLPGAHSDNDIIVRFKSANFIHAGDLFLSNGFPIIDLDSGGTINGYLESVDRIVGLCDAETVVMAGHGPVSDREGLRSYRRMLAEAKERIMALIKEHKTLEEILSANVTAGLYKGGESWLDPRLFVFCVYKDLQKSAGSSHSFN